jgi:hypothetical protein
MVNFRIFRPSTQLQQRDKETLHKEKGKEGHYTKEESNGMKNGDDDDDTYYGGRIPKGRLNPKGKKSYGSLSFDYSSISNVAPNTLISVPTGKLHMFDGTNFFKWKHLMNVHLVGLHPELWDPMSVGIVDPKDPIRITPHEV